MLNQKSVDAVSKSKFGNNLIKPLYGSYCFSRIPATIQTLFGIKEKNSLPQDVIRQSKPRYKKVALFVLDGFGWSLFQKEQRKPSSFISKISKKAIVSQLTSQFPSSTAVEITTSHTGLPVDKTGIYEWFYYEEKVDAVIAPLLFSFAGDKIRNTLSKTNIDPREFFPHQTFYSKLKQKNIQSRVYVGRENFPSPYLDVVTKGAKVFQHKTSTEALTDLFSRLKHDRGKNYYFFYHEKIDSLADKYGPHSNYCNEEINSFFNIMERILLQEKYKGKSQTLIILTADHGQITADPRKTIYLNKIIPGIERFFKKTKKGEPIIPSGSCRDMFLYIPDHYLEKVKRLLVEKLKNNADVYTTRYLIKQNFFGSSNNPSNLLNKIGDIVILPHAGKTVWWNKDKKFTIKHLGHHGGLTQEEMLIPFICFEI